MSNSSLQTSMVAQDPEPLRQDMEAVREDRFLLHRYFQVQAQALEIQPLPTTPLSLSL
jgi:hypothetical protein